MSWRRVSEKWAGEWETGGNGERAKEKRGWKKPTFRLRRSLSIQHILTSFIHDLTRASKERRERDSKASQLKAASVSDRASTCSFLKRNSFFINTTMWCAASTCYRIVRHRSNRPTDHSDRSVPWRVFVNRYRSFEINFISARTDDL